MSFREPEEIEAHYVRLMGPELGTQFNALYQELTYLHLKWAEYVELFGHSERRVELLNDAAPMFFRIMQDTFWDDLLLHIARLTDSPQTGGNRKNLSLRNLTGFMAAADTKRQLDELLDAVASRTKFCRDWRNRRIAHCDLELALHNKPARPLLGASRTQVKEALSSMAEALNFVAAIYEDSSIHFEMLGGAGGAISLLHTLQRGVAAQANWNERLLKNELTAQDFAEEIEI